MKLAEKFRKILMQDKLTVWLPQIFLLGIIILAFCLRLYKIDNPIADWHSWRQADTSSVSRHFAEKGVNLLIPRFDDLSNIPSGKENPEGYRFVEFPLYNLFHFLFYKIYPQHGFEYSGRLISIFLSLGTLFFLYKIGCLLVDRWLGLLSAFFFAVLPFSVYYSRVILPEPLLILCGTGMVYLYLKWIELSSINKRKSFLYLLFATLFSTAGFLIKPFIGFYLFPVAWLIIKKRENRLSNLMLFAFSGLISLLPFVWWRRWMLNFPQGIPASSWLFNSDGIRFKGAFFYWIFAERIGRMILGYWGLVLLGLGLISKIKNNDFFLVWFFGGLGYLFLLATGNVKHDYYQVILIPIICLILARGIYFLFGEKHAFYRLLAWGFGLVVIAFTLAFSWYSIRGYYNVNRWEMVEAGKMAREILPKEAKVVAPYAGDTSLLYQAYRQGWPEVMTNIEDLIKMGATHYISIDFSEMTKKVMEKYKVLFVNNRFVIIDLLSAK